MFAWALLPTLKFLLNTPHSLYHPNLKIEKNIGNNHDIHGHREKPSSNLRVQLKFFSKPINTSVVNTVNFYFGIWNVIKMLSINITIVLWKIKI